MLLVVRGLLLVTLLPVMMLFVTNYFTLSKLEAAWSLKIESYKTTHRGLESISDNIDYWLMDGKLDINEAKEYICPSSTLLCEESEVPVLFRFGYVYNLYKEFGKRFDRDIKSHRSELMNIIAESNPHISYAVDTSRFFKKNQ
jgi:hypothetical protein